MPNPLEEALAALIAESDLAERHLAGRVTREAGGAALAVLFGATEPEAQVEPVEPVSAAPVAAPEPIDWTSTDAAIAAARGATSTPSTPAPDAAPASSSPSTDEALLAALNAPTEGA